MTQGQIILGTIWLIWTVFSVIDIYDKSTYKGYDSNGNTLTTSSTIYVLAHFIALIAYGVYTW